MKEKAPDPKAKRNDRLLGFAVITVFTTISSAFFGGILAGFFGDIVAMLGLPIQWWQGVLIGGVIGLVLGAIRATLEIRRSARLEEFSSQLGLKPLHEADVAKVETGLKQLLTREVDLIDGFFLSRNGAHIVAGDLRIEIRRDNTPGNSSSRQDPIQTCVIFQFDDFAFPEFELQPEGLLTRMLDGLVGSKDIDFDDSPKFSDRFLLSGPNEENVRTLFSSAVRKQFEENEGLKVVASGKQLILFRPEKLCPPDRLKEFVVMAMECVEELQSSAVNLAPGSAGATAKPMPPRTKEEAIEQLASGGVIGALVKHQVKTTMVDNDDLEAFLSQSKPRQIPKELKKRFGYDPLVAAFALMALFVGGAFVLTAIFGGKLDSEELLVVSVLGPGVMLLGATILGMSWYFRNRKMRVLRSGELIHGVVKSVEETAWVLGNERVYLAKFQPQGKSDLVSAYMRGCNIQLAQELAKSGRQSRLLFDSVKPDNSLLIECYSF